MAPRGPESWSLGGERPDNRLSRPLSQALSDSLPGMDARWADIVRHWMQGAQGQALIQAVEARQAEGAIVYPDRVLRALELTPFDAVRVLILGQDPYHGPGQAQGLAFSVAPGQRLPPSLRNILQEVWRDLHSVSAAAQDGDLSAWARQGVLLLNTSLSVEQGRPAAHARLGWESLTDALIRALVARPQDLAVLLWGAHAQGKRPLLPPSDALLVLSANHPSPLSARRPPQPFLGCGHFSQVNRFLAIRAPKDLPVVW